LIIREDKAKEDEDGDKRKVKSSNLKEKINKCGSQYVNKFFG
jgi:hypothetical protein